MTDTYSRLYHRFAKEYPAIYADDRALAWWVRLLVLADAAWPIRPPLPRSIRKPVLAMLTTPVAGGETRPAPVIVQGDSYTVLGLDAERIRRSNAGRKGAAVRWESERNATGNANASGNAMPRRDETRRDEIPPPPAERGRRKDKTNPRAKGTNPRANGTNPREAEAKERREAPIRVSEILRRSNALGSKA